MCNHEYFGILNSATFTIMDFLGLSVPLDSQSSAKICNQASRHLPFQYTHVFSIHSLPNKIINIHLYKYSMWQLCCRYTVTVVDIFIFMLFNLQIIINKAYANAFLLNIVLTTSTTVYSSCQQVRSILLHLSTRCLSALVYVINQSAPQRRFALC